MTQSYQNYDRTICDDVEESLSKIVSKIPDCSVVLDVGCSTGMLGRHLAEKKGCIVDGVDFDSDAVELCRPKYRFTAVKNLESEPLTDVFKAEAYDYIVIADVIEHLINPDNLLLELKKLVKPNGTVIFSVPNITHIASALELLLGNFDYRKNGLLDSTHLRFYSYSNLISKLKSAGLYDWETDVVRKNIDETEFGSDQSKIFPKKMLDALVSARPDSLVYQWIVSTKIYPSLDQIESDSAIKDITAKPIFTTALFWEDRAGSGFNDINKLVGFKGRETENEFIVEFNFRFLPGHRIHKIRIDPVSEKKVVWIKSAKIVSDQNAVIWEWSGAECESGLINAKWIDTKINIGKLLSADNDDPQWYPDILAEIMQEITSGARFSFVMCSCDDIVDSLLVDALSAANQAVTQERHELAEMLASKSWKITRPLRFVERVFNSSPSSIARRVFSGTGHVLWRTLPISTKSKQKIKGKLFKTLPWAFHRTNAYHVWSTYRYSSNCSPVINIWDEQAEDAANEHVPLLDYAPLKQKPAKLICFYLPQFHAIPENDEWWGDGFTEWTNVKPAQPQFEGHYQPHVPGELGYYNLLDPAVQSRQVELAKLYGIEGFCFYFYWFGGKRLLEKPIENYLNDDALDLPFCLCWANENWSRRWDGLDNDILISQHHSEEDDLAFIKHISKYLKNSRYIRIDDKPLLLVYRPSLLPSAKETVRRWREWCRENGVGEIYLTCTQSFDTIDPIKFGFDAAVEFPPNNTAPPSITEDIPGCSPAFAGEIYDWSVYPERSKNYQESTYTLFRGVTPSWDNTARKKENGTILYGSSPLGYQQWLTNAIRDTTNRFSNHDQRLVFINAWNEWAEGAHLEPDQRYGYAYLEATRMAQIINSKSTPKNTEVLAIIIHAFYEDIFVDIMERLEGIKDIAFKLFVTTPREKSNGIDSILESSGFEYHLLPVDNHGRDVLPFLKIIQRVVDEDYAYILKIQTKKSEHREDGSIWRTDLYNKLLSKESMLKAIMCFKQDENIGLIGPAGHIVSMGFYWGLNKRTVESLATRMGQTVDSIKSLNFVAGNMFFARVDALLPLLNLAMSEDDFEQEAGQVDGTFAHAIERLISISAKAKSYKLIDTNMDRVYNETESYKFASK